MADRKFDNHGFDSTEYTVPPSVAADYGSETEPLNVYGGKRFKEERPRNEVFRKPSRDIHETEADLPVEEDEGATEVVEEETGKAGGHVPYVVGWLVGVSGDCTGRDYRLHVNQNKLGRGEKMDIRLTDKHISREPELYIYYDPISNEFFADRGSGKCLCYINNKLLRNSYTLEPFDRIKLAVDKSGTALTLCELLFVPLCGEKFNWSEINTKEEVDL